MNLPKKSDLPTWTVITLMAVAFYGNQSWAAETDGGQSLPACASSAADIMIRDMIFQNSKQKIEATSIEDVETLGTDQDKVACRAKITLNNNMSATFSYEFTWTPTKPPKYSIKMDMEPDTLSSQGHR
jgi:hypothetical protein